MGTLIYSMIMSLDGYTEDEHGGFGWSAPDDEDVHYRINELASSFGTEFSGQMIVCPMVVGGENGSSRMVYGWTWSWSRSDDSAREWSFCDTPTVADRFDFGGTATRPRCRRRMRRSWRVEY
jgi:hypothetical protein